MSTNPSVVVTGMGVVTPIGIGVVEYWNALLEKRNGVRIRPALSECPWPLKLYSPVEDFDGKQWVRPRKALKVMCLPIQFGYTAATMALDQSGIIGSGIDPDRLGTVFGSETFFADPQEVASVFRKCVSHQNYIHERWGEFAMREIQPLWMLKYLPNMVTSHISIAANARGPSNSICQGEVSGLLALIEGTELIQRGVCDAVVVGGTGSQTSLSGMLYRGQQSVSSRIDDPAGACRPFDADRDGTVYGEGAGAIVLESESHARARSAEIMGTIGSWSRSFCAGNDRLSSSPNKQSAEQSLKLTNSIATDVAVAMRLSDLVPADLSHINAHGCGAVSFDAAEAQAIEKTLGDVPVIALKSNYGQLGPGSSTIETIASLVALDEQLIPPTRNYETPDSSCPVNVNVEVQKAEAQAFIKVSFSEVGQIACIALHR